MYIIYKYIYKYIYTYTYTYTYTYIYIYIYIYTYISICSLNITLCVRLYHMYSQLYCNTEPLY